jgi:5-oxoprolinase (ATP-hydrolysing) subunit B
VLHGRLVSWAGNAKADDPKLDRNAGYGIECQGPSLQNFRPMNHTAVQHAIVAYQGHDCRMADLKPPRIMPCGDAALTVEFGVVVDPAISARVLALDRDLAASAHSAVREAVPTYRSLLVYYDPVIVNFSEMSQFVANLSCRPPVNSTAGRHWRVPVVYGGDFGIDLTTVAHRAGMSEIEVVRRHTEARYRVYMLGFLPGFSYLGGLDPALAMPRRDDPRLVTPAGTISIGGVQAGIQCLEGPSGWHLLGRTPVRTYHPTRDPMFLIAPGDEVTFFPVPPDAWSALNTSAEAGDPVAEIIAR